MRNNESSSSRFIVALIMIAALIIVGLVVLLIASSVSERDVLVFEYPATQGGEIISEDYYHVKDIKNSYRGGWLLKKTVIVAAEYRGKPVKAIEKIKSEHVEKIIIENGVEIITRSAFIGDISLKEVVVPASITSIERLAFKDCDSLTTIKYDGTMEQWNNINVNKWYAGCPETCTIVCTDGSIVVADLLEAE